MLSTKIKHIPYGLSPYKKDGCERVPADPFEGDAVSVNAVIEPDGGKPEIVLIWRKNGVYQSPVQPVKAEVLESGRIYCTFELGCFKEGDKVAYLLQAEERNEITRTKEYEFTVFKRYQTNEILDLEFKNNRLAIRFKEQDVHSGKLYLYFEDGSLRLYYTLGEPPVNAGGICSFEAAGNGLSILKDSESGHLVEIDKKSFRFAVKDGQGCILIDSPSDPSKFIQLCGNSKGDIKSLKLSFSTCSEHYYGFGERFNKVDQSGGNPDVHVIEQFTNQREAAYMPMPFFVTEKNYGMFLNSSFYTRYGLANGPDRLLEIETRIDQSSPFMDLYIFFGTPKDIIKKYLDVTGHPALPPKWAFGPWMSSNRWNTQEETLRQVDATIKYDIPATAVVIEAWSDETTFYIFNDARYKADDGSGYHRYADFTFDAEGKWPDPKKMTDYIHDKGMKLVLWQIPVIKYVKNTDNEQHIADERHAVQAGYCVLNADGSLYRIPDNWFSQSLIPDFSNPGAEEWWFNKRKYLVEDLGVDGFKTDGAEFVYLDDLHFHNGKSGAEMRNRYPIDYISGYHGFAGENRVTFSRAGFTGAQKYPIYWAGDQESTFSELRSVLNAGLSVNMSGNPFWSFDIGGFFGELPGSELYIRSAEMAVFCPVMQYHSSPPDDSGNNDRTPWNISEWNGDPAVIDTYRRYANIRMNLLPYIYQEARFIARSCEPLMRHLVIDYPDDGNVYGIDDEYLFGRDMLIAPIITEGCRQRGIYLPDGEWIDFWDGTAYKGGGRINYPCGIDRIPVFIKSDSVIPMNLNEDFELGGCIGNETGSYKNLCFVIFGRLSGEYAFFDDLGNRVTVRSDGRGLIAGITGNVDKIYIAAQDSALVGGSGCKKQSSKEINGISFNVYEVKNLG